MTFLPVSSVRGKAYRDRRLEREPGFVGFGPDCVGYDGRYQGIIDYLLGRVVLVDNMDNALRPVSYTHLEEASEEPAGTVLSQDPKPGSKAEKGTAINVVVSDGSKAKAVVPYLVGKPIGDAQAALINAGLQVGSISYDYSSTYAEGEVMWQQYDANAQLDKGTSVKIRVSKGKKPEPQPTQPSSSSEEDDE